jgi:hypothetical protein
VALIEDGLLLLVGFTCQFGLMDLKIEPLETL